MCDHDIIFSDWTISIDSFDDLFNTRISICTTFCDDDTILVEWKEFFN